jgi:hypothetical protein
MILTRNLCLNRINNVNFSIQKTIFCRFLDKLNSHLIDNMIFGFSMVELVRINVSFVPKLKKIFSTLTPSSGQTKSSIGSSHISLESVLHKLSFDIKISRLPVDPKKHELLLFFIQFLFESLKYFHLNLIKLWRQIVFTKRV